MKRIAVIALIILAGACTAGTLQAQSHEVRANVPFDFDVGSKTLPAGHYTFFTEPNDTVVIRKYRIPSHYLSRTEEASTGRNVSQLVFDRYGDHYFLREISCPSIALNVEIPPSKLEKQVREQRAWLGPEHDVACPELGTGLVCQAPIQHVFGRGDRLIVYITVTNSGSAAKEAANVVGRP